SLQGDEPQRGPDDALVTIVELGDFECPFCARVAQTLEQIERRYGDDVRIVWMNLPLPFHKNAKPAATAALEAQAQKGDEGFWAIHDKIFANQSALTADNLEAMAEELGLDPNRLSTALAGDAYAETIARQQSLAEALGARGTPVFFINGRNLRGAQPLTRFTMLIDEELARARALVAQGTPKSKVYETTIAHGITKVQAPAPTAAPAPTPSKVYDIPLPKNPRSKGPANAKVVIQEFSDFQCPVCRRVLPTLDRVQKEYGKQVRIVYRDYPLDFHRDAHLAAQAAREVFAQKGNKAFWAYHDVLLANQRALSRADLERYARQARGIDMKAFRAALDSGKHKAGVDADMRAIAQAGARIGTPAFFINGKLAIQGAYPFETFQAAIDAELN
ncbi:MAG: thioredoxin domain-containing protein, partial [Desulfobacterales bacterium]|nr:thioredoxin domain-containing protein [Desulfobacterales bacterium]